jgi:hypothetical protein
MARRTVTCREMLVAMPLEELQRMCDEVAARIGDHAHVDEEAMRMVRELVGETALHYRSFPRVCDHGAELLGSAIPWFSSEAAPTPHGGDWLRRDLDALCSSLQEAAREQE